METHKRENERSKWDRVWVGLLLGLGVPFVVMMLYWYAMLSKEMQLGAMFTNLGAPMFMKVLSICASPDLLVFVLFNKKNWTEGSKGLVLAVLLLLLVTIIIKM